MAMALAAASAGAAAPDANETVDALTARVQDAHTAGYEAALGEFDGLQAKYPDDVELRIGKCRFLQSFAWSEDATIERAAEDYEQCQQQLREGPLADNASVQLFLLDNQYGEVAIETGEQLRDAASGWAPQDRARLFETLSYRYRSSNEKEADYYSRLAVEAWPASKLRIDVAETWFTQGAFDKARDLVETTPPDAWGELSVYRAAVLLLRAGAPAAAAKLLQQQAGGDPDWTMQLLQAAALGEAGEAAQARKLFGELLAQHERVGIRDLRRHVKFELVHGDAAQATAAYRRLRDAGFDADPFARYRMELALRHPLSPWQWRDSLGILLMLAVLAGAALLPSMVVAGVHYRSLAKRARGILPQEGRWGLGHVWYALAAFLVGGALATWLFAYDVFAGLFSDDSAFNGTPLDPAAVARLLLAESAIVALLLLPMLRGTDLKTLFLGKARLLPTIGWALLALVVVRIISVLYTRIFGAFEGTAALGDVTTFAIQSAQLRYGVLVTFGMVAVLVPVIEEFVFRGVVLQGLARHIRFGWAALLQAAVFAVMHESLAALPIIFLLGLAAAWLVRRTGGLLAPILMHSMNNAAALGAINMATRAITL
jgi:membrane protease YdiL (CAAX protease family)